MMDAAALTTFLGWTLVVHVLLLAFAALFMIFGQALILPLHQRLLGMEEAQLRALYVQFIGSYKLLVLVFSAVPYFALKLMGY